MSTGPYQYAKTDTSTAPYAHLPIQLDDNINTHPSSTPGSSQPLVYSLPPTIYSSGDYQKRPSQHPNQRSSSFDESGILRPANLTRFTLPWFKYRLKQQVRRKRLGRLLYVISGFVLLLIWLTITVFFGYHLESSEASNSSVYANSQLTGPPASHGEQEQEHLFLLGQLNSFDPLTRSLNIDWSAFYGAVPLNPKNLLATQVDIDRRNDTVPLAMFRDVFAVPDKGTNITDYQPFRIQNPHVKPAGFLGLTQFDQINTNIALGQRSSNIWLQPEFGYPFDVFRGTIVWVAANNETITRTGRPGTDVRPISGAVLTDSLLNMKVRVNATATCLINDVPGCELIVQVWVTRTGLVKFCVFVVFGINWFVTIALFLLTGESLLLNRHNILESTDIFAVCFAALFALPSVRSLLPGVPGVGCALDMLGILPNMIIITLCTVFFAVSRLRLRHTHHGATEDIAAAASNKDQ